MTTETTTALPGPFRRLWAASAVSNLGDGVRLTALPLLATELTSNPNAIAGVAVAQQLPWLLFALHGGVLADRYDRRNLRIGLDTMRAVAMGALTLLIVFDRASIIALFVVAAIISAAEVVVDTSSMALIPSLVDESQLERAGGIMSSTELIAGSLAGPPLGGLLFAGAVAAPFGFDAMSFLLAALVASTILGGYRATGPDIGAAVTTSMRGEIAEGFRWLWQHPLLRNLALVSTALGFANLMAGAVLVLFARETLDLGPFGFGLLLVPSAVGGVFGSLLAQRLRNFRLGLVLGAAVMFSALAMIAIGFTTNAYLVGLLSAFDAAAVLVWNVLTVALRQRLIPDHLLGRVGACYSFFVFLAMPLGAVMGGLIADVWTLPTVFVVAGTFQLAVAMIVPYAARTSGAK